MMEDGRWRMENREKTKDEGRMMKDERLWRLEKITFKKFKSYIEIYFES